MYMLILNFTYPLRCLRVPQFEYHCPILSQLNQPNLTQHFRPCFFKICFIIVLPSTPWAGITQSVVGYGLDDWCSIPSGAEKCSPHHRVQTGSGSYPASYTIRTGDSFPGGEADRSPPSKADFKNAWSYTSTHPYVFIAWYLSTGTYHLRQGRPIGLFISGFSINILRVSHLIYYGQHFGQP